ncbi:hypothetical protein WJX72_009568 [[Myrmecia] bisecta]|uniref:Uncharacterized protein n=1 Tax=[Myrmecia] bisecta TaxID=41462 RepID=A0AAW1R956_9CHLO
MLQILRTRKSLQRSYQGTSQFSASSFASFQDLLTAWLDAQTASQASSGVEAPKSTLAHLVHYMATLVTTVFSDLRSQIHQENSPHNVPQRVSGDAAEARPGLLVLVSSMPKSLTDLTSFLDLTSTNPPFGQQGLADGEVAAALQQAVGPQLVSQFHAAGVRLCWLDSGREPATPQGPEAVGWRVGCWQAQQKRYAYGVVSEFQDGRTLVHLDAGGEKAVLEDSQKGPDWLHPAGKRLLLDESLPGAEDTVPGKAEQSTSENIEDGMAKFIRDNFGHGIVLTSEDLTLASSPFLLAHTLLPLLFAKEDLNLACSLSRKPPALPAAGSDAATMREVLTRLAKDANIHEADPEAALAEVRREPHERQKAQKQATSRPAEREPGVRSQTASSEGASLQRSAAPAQPSKAQGA